MPDGIADGDFRFPAGRIRFGRESDFAARRFGDRPADVSAASVAISGFFLLFPVRYGERHVPRHVALRFRMAAILTP